MERPDSAEVPTFKGKHNSITWWLQWRMNWSFIRLAKESRVNIKADIKYRFFILTAQTLINEELQHTHWIFGVEAVLVIVLIVEKHNTTLEKRRVNLYCEENRVVSLLLIKRSRTGLKQVSTVSKLHYLIQWYIVFEHVFVFYLWLNIICLRGPIIVLHNADPVCTYEVQCWNVDPRIQADLQPIESARYSKLAFRL